jgi:hypothetical protein
MHDNTPTTTEQDPCPCGYDDCSLARHPDALCPRTPRFMEYGDDWPPAPERVQGG